MTTAPGDEWPRIPLRRAVPKRCLDILGALLGLAALSPLFLLLAVLIRRVSHGPVFYRGVRTGRFGRPFRIFKFRTMVLDAEARGGTTTGEEDPRVIPYGGFLRRSKLDELPQLINVLRGEMSLVGPRPEVPEYTDRYGPEEQVILSVRPGITDLASLEFVDLSSHVGREDPDGIYRQKVLPRKNALRIRYVREQSFLGDLVILARTAVRVLAGVFKARRR